MVRATRPIRKLSQENGSVRLKCGLQCARRPFSVSLGHTLNTPFVASLAPACWPRAEITGSVSSVGRSSLPRPAHRLGRAAHASRGLLALLTDRPPNMADELSEEDLMNLKTSFDLYSGEPSAPPLRSALRDRRLTPLPSPLPSSQRPPRTTTAPGAGRRSATVSAAKASHPLTTRAPLRQPLARAPVARLQAHGARVRGHGPRDGPRQNGRDHLRRLRARHGRVHASGRRRRGAARRLPENHPRARER